MTDFHAAPDSWLRKQLKWAVTFQRGHDLPDDAREEGPVPVYAGGGITGWHKESCASPPGIVTGRYGTIGEFHLVSTPYWPLNTALYSIDLHSNDPEYLCYLLDFVSPLFHVHAGKSAVPGVDRNDIHTIPVALPGREQQRQIAAFLGGETRRIDGLLATKQRVLDLLSEKRKAIIATAVTHGLDPKVKLRDSGVPWLGEILAHWPLVPLRYLVAFLSGGTPDKGKADFWVGGTIPWVSPKDMKVEVIDDSEDHITRAAVDGSATRIVPIGSVLIVVRGMILAHTLPVAVTSGPVTINQDIKALVCGDRLLPDFLRIVLVGQSRLLLSLADSSAHGTKKLETEALQRLEVPAPSLDEQRAVVAHIARETAKLDAVRAATERTIVLLKERRSALIAAAVTGQLDVGLQQ